MPNQATRSGAILAMNGEFGVTQRDRLKQAFDAVQNEQCVILDVAKTAFIDSTVLGSLLRLRADVVRNGGSFVVAAPSTMVQRLLEITMLTQMFDVRRDANEVEGSATFRRIEVISDETPRLHAPS
jgi:anti-anti-sigma factor